MTAPITPVVFIHGLWLHANSWQPWMDLFKESGYDPIAPGWPGEAATVAETRKTEKEFRFGFGNALSEEESTRLFEACTIPSPARPLFQAAAANFVLHSEAKVDTGNQTRGPLLLISGTADHTVPDVVTRSTLKQYRDSMAITQIKQFEGRGHSLTIDSGWPDVAKVVLAWLTTCGL